MKQTTPVLLAGMIGIIGNSALAQSEHVDFCDNSVRVDGNCVTQVVPVADFADAVCTVPEEPEAACPSPGDDFYGQDAHYLINPEDPVLEDGVWKETVTGLWWNPVVDEVSSLADAEATCAEHGQTNLGGRDDWRVPELREFARIFSPRYDSEGSTRLPDGFETFESFQSLRYYYTSTKTGSTGLGSALSDQVTVRTSWSGNIEANPEPSSGLNGSAPNSQYFVHCVSGPVMSGAWQREDDGDVVLHTTTGLTWEQAPTLVESWGHGLEVCNNATTGNFDDWRAPTLREGISMLDTNPEHDTSLAPVFESVENPGGTNFVASTAHESPVYDFPTYDEGSLVWAFYAHAWGSDTELAVRCVRGPEAVPEPSASFLSAIALGLVAALRRKRTGL